MRTRLSLVLTLALTTSSVAHAGWSREQRATLDAIIALENAATKLNDAGKLATVVERYEQEFARADVPNGYRRTVAKRGKAVALALLERTNDPGYLCSALKLLRVYANDLVETEKDRLEIPNEIAELEARAVTVSAPCAAATTPEPTAATAPEPAEAASATTAPPQPQQPAATVAVPERQDHAARRPPRRTRGQIAGGVSLFGVAVGLGGGAAACFAGREPDQARIAALDQRATEAGRELTEDEWSQVDAADGRYARLSNTGKALGVFAGISFIAAVILLSVPHRPTAKIRAGQWGAVSALNFSRAYPPRLEYGRVVLRRPRPRSLLARVLPLAVLLVLACTEHAPAYYNLTDEAPDTTGSTAASFPEPVSTASTEPENDTTSTSGANASGEDAESTSSGESSGGTSGPVPNAPPEVYDFFAKPDEIDEPGPVLFELAASDDVVEVDVWHDGELLGTYAAADFPVTFEVTSQNTCQGAQKFIATVRDAEGLTADSLPADLFCQLPAPGSEVYTSKLEGVSSAFGSAIALMPDGGVVVAGALDERMLLWRLDATGTPIAGWPKTIKDWTLAPGLGAEESGATAVAVDATGAIIVAGFYKNGIASRRYTAKLNDAGTLLWEDPGLVDGEEIAGLAVPELGDVVTAGSIRTSPLDQDARYDAGTWGYPHDYPYAAERWSDVFVAPLTDPHPDLVNERSERWRAVLALPDGRFAVIGEREYKDGDLKVHMRATVLQFEDGSRTGDLWTSSGQKYANDAAMAGTLTSTGFAVTGWCRGNAPNAVAQACVQIFDEDGSFSQVYAEPSDTQASCLGVARDREDRLVLGCYRTLPGQVDAWVFASRGAGFPLAWSQTFDQGGWDFAAAVACESWGKCTWVGMTTENGAAVLVASQRYP